VLEERDLSGWVAPWKASQQVEEEDITNYDFPANAVPEYREGERANVC